MTRPLVSVIVPCWNATHTIGQTLECLRGQTWPNIEIVVVDDGSEDDGALFVERFNAPNVRLIRHSTNRGQTAALNTGLANVHGAFIQYLDADDLISRDKIELQMARLVNAPNCVASGEWGLFSQDPIEATSVIEPVWRDMNPLDWLAERLDSYMLPSRWLIPRSVVDATGPWREDLTVNNDNEYFTRMLLASERVLFCPGARCFYRRGDGSNLSARRSLAAARSQFEVFECCERYVLARENSERMRRVFAITWQNFAYHYHPYAASLAEEGLKRAARLHAVRVPPPGGRAFHLARRFVGWRLARRLAVASGRR